MESNCEKKMELISIIIPIHNAARFIRDCVARVLKQTYTKIEVILVDDGSTDNSKQMMEELAATDHRIICVYQENRGCSAARNYGLKIAKGKYICFIDADDVVAEDYVWYLWNLIEGKEADISLVPHPQNFVGDVCELEKSIRRADKEIELMSGEMAAEKLLYHQIKESCWSKLYTKSFLDDNNIRFREQLFCGEGFNFCMECFLHAKKVAVGYRKIYFYRLDNEESAMTRFNIKLIQNGLMAMERIGELVANNNPKLKRAYNYTKWHTNCDFFNMFVGCRIPPQKYTEYFLLQKNCRRMAKYGILSKVAIKEKTKAVVYMISPCMAASTINRFRLRRFKT